MTRRAAQHTSFVLERRFTAPPARMFKAWADPNAKRRWSDCHADGGTTEYSMDFRPGGREIHRATLPNGKPQLIEKTFLEIVPDARIIFAYGIESDGHYLSASLVTAEFHPDGAGTRAPPLKFPHAAGKTFCCASTGTFRTTGYLRSPRA